MKEGFTSTYVRDSHAHIGLAWGRIIGEKVKDGLFGKKTIKISEVGDVVGYKCEECNFLEFRVENITRKEQ